MTRRQRAYIRRSYMELARRYLGVKRLPAGVPAMVREHVRMMEALPDGSDQSLLNMLRPYRRRDWRLL